MPQAWSEWGFWSYAATATQSNVAGGTIIIDVSAGLGNVIQILYAQGIGTFAGAQTFLFRLYDEDNNNVLNFGQLAATGSLTIPRALTDIDSNTNSPLAPSLNGVILAGSDLKFTTQTTTNAAQNDTVQILLVAKVKNGPGAISVSRSGGTVSAPTVTVNEVY